MPKVRSSWIWRAFKHAAILVYCVAIFLMFDFAASALAPDLLIMRAGAKPPRLPHPNYHHTLAPRFDGVDRWGDSPYRLITNSLGFKDATIREISPKSDNYRILLIGDSFTEGIGLEFQNTFAGMLYDAGQQRPIKVDFLNAGVVSYSPTVYFAKIKHLIDSGVQLDEVVVLPDLSDVQDEAVFYFCFDDIPEYRARCTSPPLEDVWFFKSIADFWQTHFVLSERLWVLVKRQFFGVNLD